MFANTSNDLFWVPAHFRGKFEQINELDSRAASERLEVGLSSVKSWVREKSTDGSGKVLKKDYVYESNSHSYTWIATNSNKTCIFAEMYN